MNKPEKDPGISLLEDEARARRETIDALINLQEEEISNPEIINQRLREMNFKGFNFEDVEEARRFIMLNIYVLERANAKQAELIDRVRFKNN